MTGPFPVSTFTNRYLSRLNFVPPVLHRAQAGACLTSPWVVAAFYHYLSSLASSTNLFRYHSSSSGKSFVYIRNDKWRQPWALRDTTGYFDPVWKGSPDICPFFPFPYVDFDNYQCVCVCVCDIRNTFRLPGRGVPTLTIQVITQNHRYELVFRQICQP